MYNKTDILAKYIESLLLQSDGGGAIRKTLATVPEREVYNERENQHEKRLLAMMMAIVMSNDAAADKRIGGRR